MKKIQQVAIGFADRLGVRLYIILLTDSQEATFVAVLA